ncbi:MAG: o-succinylbenzoate synthase [Bacteroidia bacterium]|nr:MAG: o-succinylbenzoate synthase [Bacteroidia bacterium]
MFRASYTAYPLTFVRPVGTSRGVLRQKPCWFIQITGEDGRAGLGEVSIIPKLSLENPDEFEIQIDHLCKLIGLGEMDPLQALPSMPGVQFALETAMLDRKQGGERLLFPSEFTKGNAGIRTNGLIWMGSREFMVSQVREKMKLGCSVLKLKVGALDMKEELQVLRWIRNEFSSSDLEIRLDANGAWDPEEAGGKLELYARYDIHSIEQPIAAGQVEDMRELCKNPAIPVALDEELIGINGPEAKRALLQEISPAYVILKPGLLGGFSLTGEWIRLADEMKIGWWITSALESNIGLNAIAQWSWQLGVTRHQGLGTGALYTNNISSPLQMSGEQLWYRPEKGWDLSKITVL